MRRATRIRSGEGRGRVDEEARSTDKGTGRRGPGFTPSNCRSHARGAALFNAHSGPFCANKVKHCTPRVLAFSVQFRAPPGLVILRPGSRAGQPLMGGPWPGSARAKGSRGRPDRRATRMTLTPPGAPGSRPVLVRAWARGPARSGQGDYLLWFKYTVYDLRKYNGTYGIIYWYVWSKY